MIPFLTSQSSLETEEPSLSLRSWILQQRYKLALSMTS